MLVPATLGTCTNATRRPFFSNMGTLYPCYWSSTIFLRTGGYPEMVIACGLFLGIIRRATFKQEDADKDDHAGKSCGSPHAGFNSIRDDFGE